MEAKEKSFVPLTPKGERISSTSSEAGQRLTSHRIFRDLLETWFTIDARAI